MKLLVSLITLFLTVITIAVVSNLSGVTPSYLYSHPLIMIGALIVTAAVSAITSMAVDANYDGIINHLKVKKYNYKLYIVYGCCIGAFLCALFASASKSPIIGMMALLLLVLGLVITVTNDLVDEKQK